VLTSRWEGFPLLVLEAFCAGVPVVAPPVGGIPDAIEHERTGLLVERTPESIAAAVERLRADPELRRRIVGRAGERVRTTFSEARMLADVGRLYDSLPPPVRAR
jgi:glycosyltransferase involved in cell wall biosynthesis